jgi:DNA ligase-1
MKFKDLALYFEKLEKTSLRNEKTRILTEIIQKASAEEVAKLIYLSLGGLRPEFDRLEFNIAEKMIIRALGVTWEEYLKVGDLGEVAKAVSNHKFSNSQISISQVYGTLEKIALESGSGSQERKVSELASLLNTIDPLSAKYVTRIVAGKLRLGFSDKTIIDALSYLEDGTKKYSDLLDRAYQVRPDAGVLAQMVKEMGVAETVKNYDIAMGTPIVPALAQRLKTPREMIEKMGKVYCEPKFDGTRVQVHFSRSEKSGDRREERAESQVNMFEEEKPKFWVRTFTRNLDESSAMFPELQLASEQIKAQEVILDCEAVGYDPKTSKLVPFQLTITRKRKHGVKDAQASVPLRFFVFDIMYLDGKSLIHLPLHERRKILDRTITQTDKHNNVLVIDEFMETDNSDVLREFHKKQLEQGLEGALVKQVDGEYMPGRTGFNWVKFKEAEDSRAKLSDTIDVVIMGYYLGKGKRSTFGLGAFLVGILDTSREERGERIILTLAKVGTGITDKIFRELNARLQDIKTKNKPIEYIVPKSLEPDVWVEPQIVVEVAADEITVSPTHSAGYALRFPRLVKFRDDKGINQITTLEEIMTMFGIVGA